MDNNNKSNFRIDIPLLKSILVIITFTLVLYWGLTRFSAIMGAFNTFISIISPVLTGFCFAFIINVLLRPLEKGWDKLFKGKIGQMLKRPICLTASTLMFFGFILAILFLVIPEFIITLESFIAELPANMQKAYNWVMGIIADLEARGISLDEFEIDVQQLISQVTKIASEYGSSVIDKAAGIILNIFSGVFNLVIAFVLSIYMLAQKERLCLQFKKILYALIPKEKADKVQEEVVFINKTFTSFVTGQVTEAFIIGILCYIGMRIFNFPYPLIVSILVGVTALIPIIGAFIGTAIGAVLILLTSPIKAIWFVIYIIVLQQIEGNLIYPKVVGRSVGLPGIWVLTAVTISGSFFGFIGMLICVPVFSILYAYIRRFTNNRLNELKLTIR